MADGQSHRKPQLIALLQAVSGGRTDLSLDRFSGTQIDWAIQTGLGPLLFRAIQEGDSDPASAVWRSLNAADLTARVLAGNQLDAMAEIIDTCRGRVPSLTLLKGISIGKEFYPEAHLRLMRDLDFLVGKDCVPAVEAMLQKHGYKQSAKGSADHHNMPFFSPGKRGLGRSSPRPILWYPKSSYGQSFSHPECFRPTLPVQIPRREVFRLNREMQLVYIACHWAQSFKPIGGRRRSGGRDLPIETCRGCAVLGAGPELGR
jgi:hypothetical protein